jgi:hypothetical protein
MVKLALWLVAAVCLSVFASFVTTTYFALSADSRLQHLHK